MAPTRRSPRLAASHSYSLRASGSRNSRVVKKSQARKTNRKKPNSFRDAKRRLRHANGKFKREAPPVPTFDLSKLNEYDLKRVVQKLGSVRTGGRFYRCSKAARDLVDRLKPVWPLQDSEFTYQDDVKFIRYKTSEPHFLTRDTRDPNLPLELCRIECVEVRACTDNFSNTVVIPEIEAMGAVGTLDLKKFNGNPLSEDRQQRLRTAAKPDVVAVWEGDYAITSPIFKDVKNIIFSSLGKEKTLDYWRSRNIFEGLSDKRTLTWKQSLWACNMTMIPLFLRQSLQFQTVHIGGRFYRSCKAAKNLVESLKPAWPLPDTALMYLIDSKLLSRTEPKRLARAPSTTYLFQFCRFEHVHVTTYSAFHFNSLLLREIEAMNVVENLTVTWYIGDNDMSTEKMEQLLAAAKPIILGLYVNDYDTTSAAFKDVKHLIFVNSSAREDDFSYWETKKIDKKTIIWEYDTFHKKAIVSFLKHWLQGESTESLEKLTYKVKTVNLRIDDLLEALNDPDLQRLMKSIVREPERGLIVEREGPGRVRISVNFNADVYTPIYFNFIV